MIKRLENSIYLTNYTILLGALALLSCFEIELDNDEINSDKARKDSNITVPKYSATVVRGETAGVATELEECSKIGVEILKKGGSAVDGAIAASLCVGVINGFASGIGGGGFSVVRYPDGKAEFIDFRESAPLLSNQTMYISDPNKSIIGGLAVGVPGEIRGYELLHSKYGKLSWKELFLPSIALSNIGFKVGSILSLRLKSNEKWILKNEQFKEVYAPNGTVLRLGDTARLPKLSAALTKISKEGAKVFYEGDIAKEIVETIQNNGGILSLKDLKNYKAIPREPVISTVLNSTIITGSAPTSGAILVSTLKLLESVTKANGKGAPSDVYHRFIETLKFGFASRTRLGDPNFSKSITDYSMEIISDEYINNLRRKVDLKHTHEPPYYNPMFTPKELPGTAHISAIDKDGIAISLTSTINLEFGSKVMTPNSGIILNNEMNDFSTPNLSQEYNLAPNPYNYIEPNKRPLSSTVPTIIVKPNGELTSLGGSGGSKILSAVIQVIVELEINSKDLKSSLDSPRIHHQLIPDVVLFEENLEKNIIEDLTVDGHNVSSWRNSHRSTVQIVRKKPDGYIEALSDDRKSGLAAAY